MRRADGLRHWSALPKTTNLDSALSTSENCRITSAFGEANGTVFKPILRLPLSAIIFFDSMGASRRFHDVSAVGPVTVAFYHLVSIDGKGGRGFVAFF